MFTIPNQSSIPKAYTQFTDAVEHSNDNNDAYVKAEGGSRLMPSGNRDRLVDCMEEFVKYTIIMRQHFDLFNDRYSERVERSERAEREAQLAQESDRARANEEKAGQEGIASTIASPYQVVNSVDVDKI